MRFSSSTSFFKHYYHHLIVVIIVIVLSSPNDDSQKSFVNCQSRSLLHWRQDLEFRLNSYQNQRDEIQEILSASIINRQHYPNERAAINGSVQLRSFGNVRFSDLIIPNGKLILESNFAEPTVRMMTNRTNSYVNSKVDELYQIQNQLDTIKSQLNDPNQRFIPKGNQQNAKQQIPLIKIAGVWVFKQVNFGNILEAKRVFLRQVNFTNVDQVLNETYMENQKFILRDSNSRLFFEGRKTFWRSVFKRKLKSGCCDRLRPLHTSRMMTRTGNQEILSPILFVNENVNYNSQPTQLNQSNSNGNNQLIIRQLVNCETIFNSNNFNGFQMPIASINNKNNFLGPAENFIQLNNLISIRDSSQAKIFKTLIFTDGLVINEADLAYQPFTNKLIIGHRSMPSVQLQLSSNDYLFKYSMNYNNLTSMQQVAGRLVISRESHFLDSLDAQVINHISNFNSFARNTLVQINRPALIQGPIQFDALPELQFNMMAQQQQQQATGVHQNHVPIMRVGSRGLLVNLLNGMRVPQDLIVLGPFPGSRRADELIVLRGSRAFRAGLKVFDFLTVQNLVNGMRMPQDVIPLHLNDALGSLGYANLAFLNGLIAHHLTIQGGYLDELNLRTDTLGASDAQSLIMRSVFTSQAEGSQLIRAPLRVINLKVYGSTMDTGLINGFRPEKLLQFKSPQEINEMHLMGERRFLNHVEVNDCIFQDINQISNWTNQLIRIDRPDTIQTIHKKLAFVQAINSPEGGFLQGPSSAVSINKLAINFHSNNNQFNYLSNLQFSPEFYLLHQALLRATVNNTEARYRVWDQLRLMNGGRINGISLDDVVTLDRPFKFGDKFTLVGKVEVRSQLRANRIQSNYPIDAMDLVQFNKYRIPIMSPNDNSPPIKLNNLVLSSNNEASFVQLKELNGIEFNRFANSIMSLTRPQTIDSRLTFNGPVDFEGFVRTEASLNGIKAFKSFAGSLKQAQYSFENGLQCNAVVIKV